MRTDIRVLRRRNKEEQPYWQSFMYESERTEITVAEALEELNRREKLTDKEGNQTDPVVWECNCLQKKCGACAMLIDGFPALACEAKLDNERESIELRPLSKFPAVKDLMVDRSALFEHLQSMKVWMKEDAEVEQKQQKAVLTASGCLQCGCCLEVCTGYTGRDEFYGTAALAGAARIGMMENNQAGHELIKAYSEHFFHGCDEFNACEHYCPAHLPVTELMAHMNAKRNEVSR